MKLTPLRILLAGWAVFLLYAYPGYVEVGAGDMLLDARSFQFGDWHSPVMARIWWVLNLVMSGPPAMLLLQSGLFVFGAYHLLRRACSDRVAAGVACGVLLFPPVLAIQAVVSAQALFAGCALAGAALLGSPRARRRIGGLAVLLVAAGLHAGTTVAVVPLVLFGFRWRDDLPRVKRYAIATAACVVIAVGAFALERSIIDQRSYRKELQLAKHDLRGIQQQLKGGDPAIDPLLELSPEWPPNRDVLTGGRRAAIRAHTGAYVAHRFRHLRELLRSRSRLNVRFTQIDEHAATLSHRARHSLVQRALIAPVRALSHTPLFLPQLYLLLALGVTVFAAMRRRWLPVVVFASGIAYELAAAVLTTSTELRLSHWLVTASVLGTALFALARRDQAGKLGDDSRADAASGTSG